MIAHFTNVIVCVLYKCCRPNVKVWKYVTFLVGSIADKVAVIFDSGINVSILEKCNLKTKVRSLLIRLFWKEAHFCMKILYLFTKACCRNFIINEFQTWILSILFWMVFLHNCGLFTNIGFLWYQVPLSSILLQLQVFHIHIIQNRS